MHIAIFGCGQLAQMTAKAGIELGLRFSFVADPGEDPRCVAGLGEVFTLSEATEADTLFEHLGKPDIITVEKEMVDVDLLDALSALTAIRPGGQAIHIAQNRIREKHFLREHGIPTADFAVLGTLSQLESLTRSFHYPLYIKAAESGYDGYHQWRIQKPEDIKQSALVKAMEEGVSLIAEKHVPHSRELSIIAARDARGDIALYSIMENRHEDGVLISTIAPAPNIAAALESQAQQFMKTLLTNLDYIGVLTMECFETDQGIVVNELAPRVHNSGHWTIEGSQTSQFENHCRAIADMGLGKTTMPAMAGIVNILGQHGNRSKLSNDSVYYHDYHKEERARRKLGHVTVVAPELNQLKQSLNRVLVSLYGEHYQTLDLSDGKTY